MIKITVRTQTYVRHLHYEYGCTVILRIAVLYHVLKLYRLDHTTSGATSQVLVFVPKYHEIVPPSETGVLMQLAAKWA